jgi:hypothetical protein
MSFISWTVYHGGLQYETAASDPLMPTPELGSMIDGICDRSNDRRVEQERKPGRKADVDYLGNKPPKNPCQEA